MLFQMVNPWTSRKHDLRIVRAINNLHDFLGARLIRFPHLPLFAPRVNFEPLLVLMKFVCERRWRSNNIRRHLHTPLNVRIF